jgi:hypothetical protein
MATTGSESRWSQYSKRRRAPARCSGVYGKAPQPCLARERCSRTDEEVCRRVLERQSLARRPTKLRRQPSTNSYMRLPFIHGKRAARRCILTSARRSANFGRRYFHGRPSGLPTCYRRLPPLAQGQSSEYTQARVLEVAELERSVLSSRNIILIEARTVVCEPSLCGTFPRLISCGLIKPASEGIQTPTECT